METTSTRHGGYVSCSCKETIGAFDGLQTLADQLQVRCTIHCDKPTTKRDRSCCLHRIALNSIPGKAIKKIVPYVFP
mgnify:CR=1 FL=1